VDSEALADAMRIVTVVEIGIAAGLAVAVLSIYVVANLHISKADQTERGTLTRHVIAISASYFLLSAFAVAEIEGYYGTPLTWRTPIGFVASNIGIYAMVEMLRFQNARLDRRDNLVRLDGTPDL
jgi:uncharacterized membrane-anchored protein